MARLMLLMLLACPLVATAQDSSTVARLEQEVRQLQREVSVLTQLVHELRNRPDPPSAAVAPVLPPPAVRTAPPSSGAAHPRWIDAGRWRSLRPGMSELEVIGELGPPTSMRTADGARILLYALEIGPSAFLAGSITLRDQAVFAIEIPALK